MPVPLRDDSSEATGRQDADRRGNVSSDQGHRSSSTPHLRRGGHVLIVDDSWDAREMYALWFRSRGYDVLTARDGIGGVEMATRVQPDVIVMDLAMPSMSGVDAAHHLRNDPRTRQIPIILLTGHGIRAIQEGALEDLENHVRQLIEARRPGPRNASA
jgi:CheY-like chemotaxis protein